MKHLSVIVALNVINTLVFWAMWSGFYTAGDTKYFSQLAAFHALVVTGSFAFFFLRNTHAAQHAVRWSALPPSTNRDRFTRMGCLAGAYGLACTNMVVAAFFWLLNGTIDIWVSGSQV